MEAEDESKAEQARFEAEVKHVIAQAKKIQKGRSVHKWEKVLREAVKAENAREQTDVAQALLALGILDRHWQLLEVREKLDRGEWVIFNVNVKVEHQHFVLLKPKSKTVAKRTGHVVLKGEANGLCAFTAALQIAKAADALEPDSSWDKTGDEQTYTEFEILKRTKSIVSSRNFATLMQVEALYEQITAHMHRGWAAAQEKAHAAGRKEIQQSDWLKESAHVLRERQRAFASGDLFHHRSYVLKERQQATRETDLDNQVRQQVVDVQESLKAETDFHIRTFERIKEEYRDEGVCSGTWIPVWAAAFNETVHMYEVSPVRTRWDETSDLFPATVFDMLDKTRKLEQADLAAGHQLKIVRTAARITNQGWYPEKFTRKRRGAADAEPEVNVPIEDAFGDEPRIERNANQMFECMKCNDFENSEKELVELHWKVCGVTFPVRELAFDLTQCAKDSRCSRRNKHCGTCKVNRKGAMAEEAAAAEAETAEGTKEAELAEQMEQSQANLPQVGLVHPPDLGRGRRACISNQQEVIHAKWRADVNAKLGTFGASLLRVMCITDQMKACNVDAFDAVETSLSDEVKSILEERTSQLRDRRYGTHSYVAMLGLLQDTQHNNESLDACTAGSTGPYRCTCAVCTRVCAHESREGRIMETVRSLMKGEDTKLAEGLREEMSTWKNSLQMYQAESERDGDTTLFTAVQFNDGTKHNMIQEFADNVDWFTAFGVQDNEIASCCVCGGPAHDAQSGYCRSKSLRYIKECLSGLLGTPEVSRETGGLAIQTTKFNGSAWRALLIAGCGHDDNILPLYTACAWGKKGAQIRKWGVGHSCLTKEYGFLAQMKETGLAAAPAGKANFAIVDMYMMKELELEHELAIPYSVSISHDLCNEEWLTQIVLREQMTTNTGKCKESCRCDEIHRVYHDDPNRTFNIGQTAMLTLNGFPEVGRAQSVSYGGDGKNAMEGMHHKGAVIECRRTEGFRHRD